MNGQPTIPPILNADQFATNIAPALIALSIGHTRFLISPPTEDRGTTSMPVHEWVATLSMSPTSANTLYAILGHSLMKYRELHGPITEDAGAIAGITQAEQASLGAPGLQ